MTNTPEINVEKCITAAYHDMKETKEDLSRARWVTYATDAVYQKLKCQLKQLEEASVKLHLDIAKTKQAIAQQKQDIEQRENLQILQNKATAAQDRWHALRDPIFELLKEDEELGLFD